MSSNTGPLNSPGTWVDTFQLPAMPFFYRIVTEHERPELLTALLDQEPKVPYLVLRTTPDFVYGIARLIRFTDDGHCVMLYCENFTELTNSPIRTPQEEADYVRALYLKHTTTIAVEPL